MMHWVSTLYDAVLGSAMSVWALVVAFSFSFIDGFFPPIPSESIITALAAIYVRADPLRLAPLVALASVGAFGGDNVAYLIGRRLHRVLDRWPTFADKVHASAASIERRGATLLLTARFIPVGRVIVNMGAGLAGFPHRRFMVITACSATLWAIYSVVIGVAAGQLIHDNPLLGAAIGVVLGVSLGVLIDRVHNRVQSTGAAPGADGD